MVRRMTQMVQIDQDAAIAFECEASSHRFQIGICQMDFQANSHTDEGFKFVFIRVHSWLERYDE